MGFTTTNNTTDKKTTDSCIDTEITAGISCFKLYQCSKLDPAKEKDIMVKRTNWREEYLLLILGHLLFVDPTKILIHHGLLTILLKMLSINLLSKFLEMVKQSEVICMA